jgi:hypothetical protein
MDSSRKVAVWSYESLVINHQLLAVSDRTKFLFGSPFIFLVRAGGLCSYRSDFNRRIIWHQSLAISNQSAVKGFDYSFVVEGK